MKGDGQGQCTAWEAESRSLQQQDGASSRLCLEYKQEGIVHTRCDPSINAYKSIINPIIFSKEKLLFLSIFSLV